MQKIPYLDPHVSKAVRSIVKKGKIKLVTHSSNFHADDICATSLLKEFFRLAFPDVKIGLVRSVDPKVFETGDIVYDIGAVYDPKTLRFDHHQTGGAGKHVENGISYSSFGLIWKHFGLAVCALHTKEQTGKIPSKKTVEAQAALIKKRVVFYIDAMDNGEMAYKPLLEGCDIFTVDRFFEMSKMRIAATQITLEQVNRNFTIQFNKMVKLFSQMFVVVLEYARTKEIDESLGQKLYRQAKDKRVIVCDRFYYFNYAKFPEPLLVVYPDPRGSWVAKNIQEDEMLYKGRFYFPEAWRGKRDVELEKETGVLGARFCHNSGFLISANTKEQVLTMVKKAFQQAGI